MKLLIYGLFILFTLLSSGGRAINCAGLLNQEVFDIQDDFRTYAVGPVEDGFRRVHVLEYLSQSDLTSKDGFKSLVLARENYNRFHDRLSSVDHFKFIKPDKPKLTSLEFSGKEGRGPRHAVNRGHARVFSDSKGYLEISPFVYQQSGTYRYLFLVEFGSAKGKTIELIFARNARPSRAVEEGQAYALYLAQKIGLKGVRMWSVKIYGEHD